MSSTFSHVEVQKDEAKRIRKPQDAAIREAQPNLGRLWGPPKALRPPATSAVRCAADENQTQATGKAQQSKRKANAKQTQSKRDLGCTTRTRRVRQTHHQKR